MKNATLAVLALFLSACPPEPATDAGVDAGDSSCRTQGCAVGQWCDPTTGTCAAGCDAQEDCTSLETCNSTTHACECAAGYHRCGTTCARNDDVATCGTSCSACPGDPLGTATCAAATCGVTCNAGSLKCGAACSACPAGNTGTQCNGAQCQASACASGRQLCQGQCPTCPAGAATTQCNGAACEAATCASGRLLCQGQCPTCPTGASTTACNGAACAATACASGRQLCQGQCPACPAQAATTGCGSAGTCVATSCNAGFVVCNGACVACAPGDAFCCKEPVTLPAGSGPAHALALDATDSPVIAFENAGSVQLARRGATGFTVQTLDTGEVGAGVSVAVDSAGVAHVSYTKSTFPYEVNYARVPASGAVSVETIPFPSLFAVGGTSIGFDEATSTVHVGAYVNGRGYYASKTGSGAWQVKYAMFDGNQIDLALWAGEPQLVASSNASSGVQASVLSYGRFVPGGLPDGGSFASSTVNTTVGVSVFHEASLTLDDAGVPWVAFQHPNFRNLRLSTLDGGTWVSQTVDAVGFASSTSVAWYAGAPSIGYVGGNDFVPRYATKASGSWVFTTIDTKPITVGDLRLKLDSTGKPHVTFWDPDPAVRRVFYVH